MNIKPLGERVVVKVLAAEEKTKSGIVLPDTATKEKPQEGEVVAVGLGKFLENGQRAVLEVKVGDKVIYSKYSGTEVKFEEQEYLILNGERDILAIVSK